MKFIFGGQVSVENVVLNYDLIVILTNVVDGKTTTKKKLPRPILRIPMTDVDM